MVRFNIYPPFFYPLKEAHWQKPLIYLKTTLSNTPLLCAELHPSLVAARSHTSDKPAPGLANRWFFSSDIRNFEHKIQRSPPFAPLCQQPTQRFRVTLTICFEDGS